MPRKSPVLQVRQFSPITQAKDAKYRVGKVKERYYLEGLDVDERIILRQIIKTYGWTWTELI